MSEGIELLRPERVQSLLDSLHDEFEGTEPELSEWVARYAKGHVEHYQDIVRRVHRIVGEGDVERVLDIGAVPGHISAILKKAGLDVTAVDLAPERMGRFFDTFAIPTHKVDLDIEALPLADEGYDLALFCEIMEHLRMQPVRALKQVHRILRDGGHLLLSVPNITPLMRWRFLLGHDYQGDLLEELNKLFTVGHMGHFRLYSRREVERILSHVGFHILDVSYGGKPAGDRGWDARLLRHIANRRMQNQLYVWARK